MQRAVEDGVFPGAVLAVRLRGELVVHEAFGLAARLPATEPAVRETIYDLASLTKPLATSTAILCFVQDGTLDLDARLDTLLDELSGTPLGSVRIVHLLDHSAGLPAWRPFYQQIAPQVGASPSALSAEQAQRAVLDTVRQEPLLFSAGTRSLYSDLGFILLGLVVERVGGRSLAECCDDRLYACLGAGPLGFLPIDASASPGRKESVLPRERIAPTEDDPWRGRIVRGEVHDENAFVMGGVAGHAGLFGTAAAVLAVSGAWLDGYQGRGTQLSRDLVRHFVTKRTSTPSSSWALGWDTPSTPSSSGKHFSACAFGHLGFTGTSLWIDPLLELEVVLLSNRVHPTRANNRIQAFRPVVHDVIYETLVGR